MHPEILRELSDQRRREMQARARQSMLARTAIRAARRRRDLPEQTGGLVTPRIPDYVDGSFRTDPVGDQVASEAGRAPAGRHAA